MPNVKVVNISKSFGKVTALREISLEVKDGECVTLLGPSGCGKTTVLKIVAGILEPTHGRVFFDGKDITNVPPEDRNIGLVFQNYALFPHMDVLENTIYSPMVRGEDMDEAKKVAHEMLELVRLAARYDAFPRELSGGMQQRVAVARALTTGSHLLLLDEPLSALDAKISAELQVEMRDMIKDLKLTAIHVTHSQEEAMMMADRIVVMRKGAVEQVGTPEEIYYKPNSIFVANFIGEANFFEVEVCEKKGGNIASMLGEEMCLAGASKGRYIAMVRPEKVTVGEGRIDGVVQGIKMLGAATRYEIKAGSSIITARHLGYESKCRVGDHVKIGFDSDDIMLFNYPEKGLRGVLEID